jgi:hypothetical protein
MHGVRDRRSAQESEILPELDRYARRLPHPIDPKPFLEGVRDRSGLLTGYGTDSTGSCT